MPWKMEPANRRLLMLTLTMIIIPTLFISLGFAAWWNSAKSEELGKALAIAMPVMLAKNGDDASWKGSTSIYVTLPQGRYTFSLQLPEDFQPKNPLSISAQIAQRGIADSPPEESNTLEFRAGENRYYGWYSFSTPHPATKAQFSITLTVVDNATNPVPRPPYCIVQLESSGDIVRYYLDLIPKVEIENE